MYNIEIYIYIYIYIYICIIYISVMALLVCFRQKASCFTHFSLDRRPHTWLKGTSDCF